MVIAVYQLKGGVLSKTKISNQFSSAHKAEKYHRRRTEILTEAAKLFAQKGYFQASMTDVASLLNIRAGALYHYFESKEKVLEEICREGGQAFCQNMAKILDSELPVEEKICQGIQSHLRQDTQSFVTSFAFDRRSLPTGVRDEMDGYAREYQTHWLQLIRLGQKDGSVRIDLTAESLVKIILSTCNGVAVDLHEISQGKANQLRDDVCQFVASASISK